MKKKNILILGLIILLLAMIGLVFYIKSESPITEVENTFIGRVIELHNSYILVEPNEDEEERKSSDKFHISLNNDEGKNYEVGNIVKITYTGDIKESYPAQIKTTKIELQSIEGFKLTFHQEPGNVKRQIIDKSVDKNYDYNVYIYNGTVEITIGNRTYPLERALKENKITMEEIINKAAKDFPDAISYDDGGSIEYHYEDYTIIKRHTENIQSHTLIENQDVYIGNKNLKLTDITDS